MSVEITQLVEAVARGDANAQRALFEQVYGELKMLARRQLRGGRSPTFDTTGLVHDAYLKLSGSDSLGRGGRRHFFALAAKAMRQIVIDHARARLAAKRGGGEVQHLQLDELRDASTTQIAPDRLLQLHAAMDELEKRLPRLSELVEMRLFAGLELREIAELQGVSERTLNRDWQQARAVLYASIYP
ncbi:MAG TPA: ECF-type sigma factor [Rhodanobacteraceae bacterium]|nr:ECF-type sigma factor [Rhodanobacteraceae bacterium]